MPYYPPTTVAGQKTAGSAAADCQWFSYEIGPALPSYGASTTSCRMVPPLAAPLPPRRLLAERGIDVEDNALEVGHSVACGGGPGLPGVEGSLPVSSDGELCGGLGVPGSASSTLLGTAPCGPCHPDPRVRRYTTLRILENKSFSFISFQ